MPIKTDSLQRKLCDLLNVRGYKPEPKNSEGKTSPTPEDADVIKFTFSQDGNDIDTVWVTIDSSHSLVIYYDDAVMREGNSKTPGLQYDDSWTGLLNQLKNWAQRRQLSFELKNKDHLASDMAQRTSMKKKEQVSEGYYPIGNKASYSDAVPNVKIILQHTRKIEEGEKRYRNISKIFVENTLGERFAVPTNKPGIARVYARHVAEGGSPYDSRGTHITSIVEEYTKMAGFVRATKNNQFNESTQQLIAEGINHYQSLRESLHKMTGHRGYNAYFESWTPTLNEEADDESSLGEMFVQETLDPRIESVMPILSKLHKKIAEMKEVTSLENWADELIDEATDLKTIPENLGPEQKRVGQLGPTEKVGKKGTIGKLVGANESVGEEVDESWKQKLGAAALAGSMAMGANARVVPGQDEPGVNRLTGKPNVAQVVPDVSDVPEQPILKGFSTSYLQKAADPNRFGRFLISVEDAKAEVDRRAAAYERRSQGDQKINEGFLDEMHADLEELSEEDFEEEYNMTKAQAKEKYSSTGSWLNEQGVAEALDKEGDYHVSVQKGKFLPSDRGGGSDENLNYLHDLMNISGTGGGPMLVTISDPRIATEVAAMYGGKVLKTRYGTYRIVQSKGQNQKTPTPEPELVGMRESGVAEGAALPPEVIELIKKIAQSSATPEHKKATIDALVAKHSNQGVAEVAGDVNSKERYHFLYPHVPLDMHIDHEYNDLSDNDLQAVKSHQRELADKLGKPGAKEQSDIAAHIQINRSRSQYDQEQAHRRKVLDAEKIKRQARDAKRKQQSQQGVAEGKDDKIAQLKKDHDTAVHWSKNETSPQKREAARQKAEKIKAHLEKQYKQGVAERARDPEDWDEGNTEPPNNFAVYINGKKWKIFKGRGRYADDQREQAHYQQLKDWAAKKSASTGKQWTVSITGETATESLDEVSWKGIKQGAAAAGLAGAMAFGASGANARVTPDGQGGYTGGFKPTATVTAPSDNKPADAAPAATPTGFSKQYLQKAADPDRFGRYLISVEKAQELLKQMDKKVGEGSMFAGAKVGHKEGPAGQWRNDGAKKNKPAKPGDLVGGGM
jgi:hypothetical protein